MRAGGERIPRIPTMKVQRAKRAGKIRGHASLARAVLWCTSVPLQHKLLFSLLKARELRKSSFPKLSRRHLSL